MRKIFTTYISLCLLLLLAAGCSGDPLLETTVSPAEDYAVAFSAYLNRSTTTRIDHEGSQPTTTRIDHEGSQPTMTRSGYEGSLTTDALKTPGFGVFAYQTDRQRYTPLAQPNFMYNQYVYGETTDHTTTWSYSPLRYWPNGWGEATSDGTGEQPAYVSFFAYAPWVAVDATTGLVTTDPKETGITAVSSAYDAGDPWVQYAVTYAPAKQVDLCWAEVNDNTLNQTKHTVAVAANAPGRIALNFRHALSSLNVQIDAIMDALTTEGSSALDDNTRIYVRSVSFEGFAASGALNLYNRVSTPAPVPRWMGNYGQGLLSMDPVTIYDGRRDRHEGSGANANEWPTGLNSTVVQTGAYTVDGKTINNTATPGVTASAVNLFTPPGTESLTGTDEEKKAKQLAAPLYVIPNGQPLRVTVAYDVETYDPQLVHQRLSDDVTYGSSVPNVISSWVRMDGKELVLEAGKKYTIKLHLGMTSVKVDVLDVKPWEDGVDVNVVIPDAPAEP